MTKPQRWWAAFTAYAAVVLVISVIPLPQAGPPLPSFDQILHILAYLIFSWILMRAHLASGRQQPDAMIAAILGAAGYGAFCELLQWVLPYRQVEGWDLLANIVGGVLGTQVFSPRRKF